MPFGKSGIKEFAQTRFHILDALKSIRKMRLIKITMPEISLVSNHRFKRFFSLGNILDKIKVTEIYQFAIFKFIFEANENASCLQKDCDGNVKTHNRKGDVVTQKKVSDVMSQSMKQWTDIMVNRPFFFRVIDPETHLIKLVGFCVCPRNK